MADDVQCPYCGAGQDICHDDGYGYDEGVKHEQQCGECEKNFTYETSISFFYEAEVADCLNGEEHQLQFRKAWPKEASRMACKTCEYYRQAAPEEIKMFAPEAPTA